MKFFIKMNIAGVNVTPTHLENFKRMTSHPLYFLASSFIPMTALFKEQREYCDVGNQFVRALNSFSNETSLIPVPVNIETANENTVHIMYDSIEHVFQNVQEQWQEGYLCVPYVTKMDHYLRQSMPLVGADFTEQDKKFKAEIEKKLNELQQQAVYCIEVFFANDAKQAIDFAKTFSSFIHTNIYSKTIYQGKETTSSYFIDFVAAVTEISKAIINSDNLTANPFEQLKESVRIFLQKSDELCNQYFAHNRTQLFNGLDFLIELWDSYQVKASINFKPLTQGRFNLCPAPQNSKNPIYVHIHGKDNNEGQDLLEFYTHSDDEDEKQDSQAGNLIRFDFI